MKKRVQARENTPRKNLAGAACKSKIGRLLLGCLIAAAVAMGTAYGPVLLDAMPGLSGGIAAHAGTHSSGGGD